ncbi:zinc ribbon domain-containing protein [Bradymonadaceae bacterium TMQ3]|uniref:Zinc ribbon domain-containing protein n=1 Tax=Lujinxingia sediminis TaxID=2480984 RepID=A0ABY0CSB2_9DELT|nr:zinc-ribbon domain-containing protein [Lujinxingia sediminis]RDV38164.1 zinc ribbon domain-containing protein [Bradymonadaceae bacterium TMQ3]RVU43637.1 zinc ribbon domain-containing protein [Lujinxingia sediminis]TXC75834.1 zinc ribbon domain-containing protein [Bradymonadales bacterium TMQ1]
MNTCPNCGKEVDDNARHCGHCGHKLQIDQKKTMLGMAAIDPHELQKRIAEARPAQKGEERVSEKAGPQSSESAGPDPEMALTEVMEPVRFPRPEDAHARAEASVASDDAQPEGEQDDIAIGPTEAMPALTLPTPASDGPEERADGEDQLPHQPTGPMEALPTVAPADERGEWDASSLPDPLAATELEMSPVDLSKTGPTSTPAAEPESESAPGAPQAAPGDAPEASTDAPVVTPTPAQGLAAQLPDNLAQLAGDPENKKRLILFVGAVVVVLLGCCILSVVLSSMV